MREKKTIGISYKTKKKRGWISFYLIYFSTIIFPLTVIFSNFFWVKSFDVSSRLMPYAQCANSFRVRTSTVLCFAFRISFNSVRKQNVLCCRRCVGVWMIFSRCIRMCSDRLLPRAHTMLVCVRGAAGYTRVPVTASHMCERDAYVWRWQSSSRDTNQRKTRTFCFWNFPCNSIYFVQVKSIIFLRMFVSIVWKTQSGKHKNCASDECL